LIWDALLHFDEDLALELSGTTLDEDDDEVPCMALGGKLGETLSLELDPLPKGKSFQGLEFYTSHSRYMDIHT